MQQQPRTRAEINLTVFAEECSLSDGGGAANMDDPHSRHAAYALGTGREQPKRLPPLRFRRLTVAASA
jgi:hypothetical protein